MDPVLGTILLGCLFLSRELRPLTLSVIDE